MPHPAGKPRLIHILFEIALGLYKTQTMLISHWVCVPLLCTGYVLLSCTLLLYASQQSPYFLIIFFL